MIRTLKETSLSSEASITNRSVMAQDTIFLLLDESSLPLDWADHALLCDILSPLLGLLILILASHLLLHDGQRTLYPR